MSKHLDPEWIRARYHDDGMTDREIGDLVDRDSSTITRARQRFGIEGEERVNVEAAHKARRSLPTLSTTTRGYERIRHRGHEVKHHRLIAVAEWGFDAVAGKHVHHEIGVWPDGPDAVAAAVNYAANLDLLDPEDHHRHHTEDRRDPETGRFV